MKFEIRSLDNGLYSFMNYDTGTETKNVSAKNILLFVKIKLGIKDV